MVAPATSFALPDGVPLVGDDKLMTMPWQQAMARIGRIAQAMQMSGTSANRPTKNLWVGRTYFDTTLNAPIWVQSVNPAVWSAAGVTTVSVATANGFAGTVATPGTTPAITLSTSVAGLVKGNGTALSAATVGTDYVNPVVVPSTVPAAGNILVGNAGATAYASVAMSGDVTLDSSGVATSTGKRRLGSVTLGVAGTSLTTGTLAACKFLEIHVYVAGYAGSDTAALQFNGSGGTAYRYRWASMVAGSVTFSPGNIAASTDRIMVGAANTANSRRVVAFVSNDSTNTEKLVKFQSVFGTGSAATQAFEDVGNGAWVSPAATQITSVSLVSSSNMLAGTEVVVFGWN